MCTTYVTAMTRSRFLVVLLLAVAVGSSRLSLAASDDDSGGGGIIPTNLGRDLRELISKAGSFLGTARQAGADGWHTAVAAADDASSARRASSSSLRSTTSGRTTTTRRARRKSAANCIPADMCRKKKVLCGKRCYRSSSGTGLNHIPSTKCVVKCKKCVPTC
ncbi:hypothetical protein GUJ93_ZPchr0014g47040 [Zizania palustris]|uniref:Uncharacterized protein n=1 Tax=Zizania palustris TaxID=103762 RepID=A0A8J5SXH6_ZIZPA|nr:hypothetical protein GUJ93_ZPchr0014g47040 [Zizania palustris]